ncbi:MAG: ABC transporter permease [Desulfocapsa sp.]|nr:MAG: ABC transporter permease [Desulfocapsa sp.]
MNSTYRHSPAWNVSWLFVLIAGLSLLLADIEIISLEPWQELKRLFMGLLSPDWANPAEIAEAFLQTLAFAILGVTGGSVFGFLIALVFHWRWVQVSCAFIRAIHELFWALIFLQIFGLHPLTGLLAIGLPYAATFAKIYAEILEEGDTSALQTISRETSIVSTFFYARLPDLWEHFKTYTLYRLECGLRSSAILGFVGLPTLGYSLSSAFMEGHYSVVWALLLLFYLLIATIRYWVRPALLPLYIIIAPFIVANDSEISFENMRRFFTEDIIPTPIKNGDSLAVIGQWFSDLLITQALPGISNTLILTQVALVTTGILSLILFPVISGHFFKRTGRTVGHVLLVVMRSTPEYILAYILLQLWGPSMLPAIVALTLHNGAIIGHLIGQYSSEVQVRIDTSRGLNRYFYELIPRLYGQFLAFLFYRWEIILRESAILGILGIATLGFYIDSSIQELHFDKAMVLIIITAFLNVLVDAMSRYLRAKLRLRTSVDCSASNDYCTARK